MTDKTEYDAGYDAGYQAGIEAGLLQYSRLLISPHAPDCTCRACKLHREVLRTRARHGYTDPNDS